MADARRLSVYGKAVALADELRSVVRSWDSLDRWTVGVQLVRAADSVGANLTEGLGRVGARDQMRFLVISRGSAVETEYWLERAMARQLHGVSEMLERAREVSRMLNGLIASRG